MPAAAGGGPPFTGDSMRNTLLAAASMVSASEHTYSVLVHCGTLLVSTVAGSALAVDSTEVRVGPGLRRCDKNVSAQRLVPNGYDANGYLYPRPASPAYFVMASGLGASLTAPAAALLPPSRDAFTYPHALSYMPPHRSFTCDDFEIGAKPLGRGAFGEVYRVRDKKTRTVCVLKTLFKEQMEAEGVRPQLQREVEVHCRLKHRNIVECYAYFHDEQNVYLLLEYANSGTLYQTLHNLPQKRMCERDAANVVNQICKALEYLHRQNVMHRDLKPENILLHRPAGSREVQVKLCDFGWSVAMKVDSRRTTLCGTAEYLPPEVAKEEVYDFGFDMWTVGILLYEMLVGRSPFATPGVAQELDELRALIVTGEYVMPPTGAVPRVMGDMPVISVEAADLIRHLLSPNPADRPGPTQVLEHAWIEKHFGRYVPQPEVEAVTVRCIAPWRPPRCISAGGAAALTSVTGAGLVAGADRLLLPATTAPTSVIPPTPTSKIGFAAASGLPAGASTVPSASERNPGRVPTPTRRRASTSVPAAATTAATASAKLHAAPPHAGRYHVTTPFDEGV